MRLRWGQDPQQVADHYFTFTGKPKAHLVLVHGGGWVSGDPQYGVPPFYAGLAQAAGYEATSIGYRLAAPGVDWRAQLADVVAATTQIRAWFTSLASLPLIVVGESAGGHLAALAAFQSALPVAGLVSLYGAFDMQALDADTPGQRWSQDPAFAECLRKCLGGTSPSEDPVTAALASPTYQALITTKPVPRVLLIHCTDDPTIGCQQSRRLAGVLVGRAASSVSYVELPGAQHGGGFFQAPPTSDLVMSFLARAAAA
jgi:acetyl esterase/lipase